MAEIAALREATETEALASLQGRPSLKLNASELAKQWGWPRSRVRRRLEAWRQSGQLPKTGRKQRPGTKPATSPRPARPAATPTIRSAGPIGRYVAAGLLGVVGIGLSAIGMIETASYSLAVGGFLFCALAMAADALTLVMPPTIGALWRRRSLAVILAGLLWCAGAAVTVANLAGYVGEQVERYQTGRETMVTGRSMAIEHLARVRDERRAIVEMRPPAVIAAALNDARRSERPALREALAMAKRRDVLDVELATFEQRLGEVPQVATPDASAAVLSDISGTTVSEHELRRWRLALLLGLPLCGGLVLSLATALMGTTLTRRWCPCHGGRYRAGLDHRAGGHARVRRIAALHGIMVWRLAGRR